MKTTSLAAIAAALSLASCMGVQFKDAGDDTFSLRKISGACAAGNPEAVLEELRQEAAKFCAGRREKVREISADGKGGIPFVRCAEATLTFACEAAR